MALQGQAALAMWWDIAPQVRAEFEDWHTHEHFPERLSIPGFRRASRFRSADGGEGFFVLYELADHSVLSSPAYLARLDAPTPWSRKMMPHHRNMVRTQCEVLASRGAVTAGHVLTVRFAADGLAAVEPLVASLPLQSGVAGAHLLRHRPPPIGPTEEQRIRGLSDRAADLVLVVAGYDLDALRPVAAHGDARGLYTLSCSAAAADMLSAPPSPASTA